MSFRPRIDHCQINEPGMCSTRCVQFRYVTLSCVTLRWSSLQTVLRVAYKKKRKTLDFINIPNYPSCLPVTESPPLPRAPFDFNSTGSLLRQVHGTSSSMPSPKRSSLLPGPPPFFSSSSSPVFVSQSPIQRWCQCVFVCSSTVNVENSKSAGRTDWC